MLVAFVHYNRSCLLAYLLTKSNNNDDNVLFFSELLMVVVIVVTASSLNVDLLTSVVSGRTFITLMCSCWSLSGQHVQYYLELALKLIKNKANIIRSHNYRINREHTVIYPRDSA